MAEELGVLLKILLDKRAQADIDKRLDSLSNKTEKVDKKSVEGMKQVEKQSKKNADAFSKETAVIKNLGEEYKSTAQKVVAYGKKLESLRDTAQKMQKFGRASAVFGTAVVGGIFGAAIREVNRQKEADAMTSSAKKFASAQERLDASFQKLGQASIKAILPLMEKAASLAEKVAKILEEHPEILNAALSIGTVAAGVGTVATVGAKGMAVYANIAGMLAKAGIGAGAGAAGGVTAAGAGSAALLVAAPIAGAIIAKEVGNAFQRTLGKEESSWKDIGETAKQAVTLPTKLALLGLIDLGVVSEEIGAKIGNFQNKLFGIGKATDEATDGAEELGMSAEKLAEKEKHAAEILSSLASENAASLRKYNDDVASVNIDASRSLADASRLAQKSLADISKSLSGSMKSIRSGLSRGLANLSASYKQAGLDAEREYQKQRSEIIAQGAESALQIQVDRQKELEQLEKDHDDTMAGLIDQRDALGIYRAEKEYRGRKSEINEAANERNQQASAETKKQLAEAQRNYNEQRALRAQEYAQQKAELKQKAAEDIARAKLEAEERRVQTAAALAEQKIEIERNRQRALSDLQRNFSIEQRERNIAANEQLRALGVSLNAETALKRQYYGIMLTDLQSAVNTQKSITSRASGKNGSLAVGGYTRNGMYELHDEEFVATRQTAKALETAIGGKLTQRSLLSLAGGGKQSVTWNDYRHFDADVSQSSRDAIFRDTIAILDMATKGA